MYPKDVTAFIVYWWGHGLTSEEIVKVLLDKRGLKVSLNTVYRKRQSMTATEMIEELEREQLRDIA
jgi:Fe2+ or Zn2+ uptake regulation protein